MFNPLGPESLEFAEIILATNSLEFTPEFSAKILGKTEKALAYLL